MAYRIAVALIMQESNSFAPMPSTVATFENYYYFRGDELLTGFGDARTEAPAFLDVLRDAGATPVPLVAAYAAASGPVTREAFEHIVGDMEERLGNAGPIDAVLLALHGALVVEDQPDGDGEIIRRLRALVPEHLPIAVSLDLHGHITPLMLQPNVFHVGYQEYPHIDMYETGERTARLLLATLDSGRMPRMALAKRPMVVSAVCARTTDGALRPVVEEARRMEAAGEVLHATLFPVQPWLDVPDLGFAALVCADTSEAAERAANILADMAFARRRDFETDLTEIEDVIRIGLQEDGLTVVSDAGDTPTGGAAADSAYVLRALLDAGAEKFDRLTYLTLCDPPAAAAAASAGPGSDISIKVGHAYSTEAGTPVAISGRVRSVSDGIYRMRDGGANGLEMDMGLTAVIAIGSIRLLIRSKPSMEWDRGMFTSQGMDLESASLVFVKSPSHFRAGFGPIASRILVASTPGATAPDIRKVPYTKVTRPLFPLDPI